MPKGSKLSTECMYVDMYVCFYAHTGITKQKQHVFNSRTSLTSRTSQPVVAQQVRCGFLRSKKGAEVALKGKSKHIYVLIRTLMQIHTYICTYICMCKHNNA
ncbi:unnamed protein product [Ceratitis capitata]|uniref:(Mediterranean fruit fly) hypothetical protein n=1 Tax=Ceratitis capitata TaxID=7213 RepID=A0A811U2Z2_CERCA|nr:unnamed protein product [Ceratitis capitata]